MTLEEERKGCIERAEALLQKAKNEGRAMTEEESQQYDAELARAEEISKQNAPLSLKRRRTAPPKSALQW